MLSHVMYAAVDFWAQMPGQHLSPNAPSEFSAKTDNALNFGYYIAIVCVVVGVLSVGANMVLSRQHGTSEEATSNAMRVGVGSLVVGATSALVQFLINMNA